MIMPRAFAETASCAGERRFKPTLKPLSDTAGPNWRAHCTRKLWR